MKTKFNVGDSVAIKGKVTKIIISNKSCIYCVHIPGYSPFEVDEADLMPTKEITNGTEA